MMRKALALVLLMTSTPTLAAERIPIVVELFTSEGCSSCPPADEALRELTERADPQIEWIALEQHVDYWNHLGWRDPFSHQAFSARQERYAQQFRDRGVYTPQMVVDGRVGFVGSAVKLEAERSRALRNPKYPLALRREGEALEVTTPELKMDEPIDILFALTEAGLETRVQRGENAGRLLRHAPVVRQLRRLGTLAPKQSRETHRYPLGSPLPAHQRVVVFLQGQHTLQIYAGAQLPPGATRPSGVSAR